MFRIDDGERECRDPRLLELRDLFFELVRIHHVALGEKYVFLLVHETLAIRFEFPANYLIVAHHIFGVGRDKMKESSGALDVTEEFCTEPFSFRRSFDESGNVSENKFVVRTKAGLQCGKRIIGDLTLCAGEFIEQ